MTKLSLPSLALDNNLPKFKKLWLQLVTPEYNQWSMSGTWAFSWITHLRITYISISWPHLCITIYRTFIKSEASWMWVSQNHHTSHYPFEGWHCNLLLLGTASYQLDKLQCIQNIACQVVVKLRKYDRVTEPMPALHWLSVHERIQYKVASIMFNCLKGNASQYLIDLLSKRQNIRQLWSSTTDISLSAFYKNIQAYNSSFASAGQRIWNSFPAKVCKLDSMEMFKKQLNTHFFT